MTASPPALALHYLGGCPGRTHPDDVEVTVHDDRFELRGHGWGWRIGFGSVVRVGEPQPSPDGEGQLLPVVWAPEGGERTLMLSGRDAGRLRFLLAHGVAAERFVQEQPLPIPERGRVVPAGLRPPSAWQRELRRMRAVTVAAMVVALTALLIVFGVAVFVMGRSGGAGHWAEDRALLARHDDDLRSARERDDADALSRALQALLDECRRLESHNGATGNTGEDFTTVRRTCATVGVALF